MAKYKLYFRRKITVPIFPALVWIVVSNDVEKTRKDMDGVLGARCQVSQSTEAWCCFNHDLGRFAIIFDRQWLKTNNIGVVSHEVFHLTHSILNWVSANLDAAHEEQGAYLHAYLMKLVVGMLIKFMR